MKKIKCSVVRLLVFLIFIQVNLNAQPEKEIMLKSFDKVIVSPYIKLILEEGDKESVRFSNSKLPEDRIHVKTKGKTLHIYLEDAKISAKNKTIYKDGTEMTISIYDGVQVVANVTYKTLKTLSIRGDEKAECKSPLHGEKFKIKMYGEASLVVQKANLKYLKASLYGENTLEIISGFIDKQVFRTFGESDILVEKIGNNITLIRAWGENEFSINANKKIKFTSVGENTINYKGKADFKKGMTFGENDIHKIE